MRKNFHIDKKLPVAKLSGLFLCFSLFAGFSFAQTNIQKSDTLEKIPLVLKLTIPKSQICSTGNSVELDVEMVNVGNKSLLIDKTALGISYSVSFFKKGIPNGIWLRSYGYNQKYGDYVSLAPNRKYNESFEFSFVDDKNKRDNFFDRAGRYDIEMKYQIQRFDKNSPEIAETLYTERLVSNTASFYLKKCRSK